jgi:ATP/maltotriose-dependent transcriptional regulator MalT
MLRRRPTATTVHQRLELLLCLAWIRHDQVENEECLAVAQRAANLLHRQSDGLPEQTRRLYCAELSALRVSLGQAPDREQALNLIRQSWDGIRSDVPETHCSVILSLAYASQRLGDLDVALEIVLTALDATIEWPIVGRCRLLHTAGFFHYCAGDLGRAELRFQQNLHLAEKHDLLLIAVISRHGLGAIADARNQLDLAEQCHLEVIKYPYLTSGKDAVVDMYSLIRIYERRGQPERSRALVERLKKDARSMGQSFFVEQVAALEAFVDLTCGDHAKAMRWALSQSRIKRETPPTAFRSFAPASCLPPTRGPAYWKLMSCWRKSLRYTRTMLPGTG